MAGRTRAPGNKTPANRFATVQPNSLPRSAFDMSHSHSTTIDSGILYPLWTEEVLPADTITFTPSFLARLTTAIVPYMTAVHLDWQVFYCPTRILWDNFTKMMGVRDSPGDHNDYEIPYFDDVQWQENSLSDYLTLPVGVPIRSTSLYHRLYNLIWREWYRDANLQDDIVVDSDNGPDGPADYTLLRRGKRKDYFSGSLPFSQRGEPVTAPIGGQAPVISNNFPIQFKEQGDATDRLFQSDGSQGFKSDTNWAFSDTNLNFGSNTGLVADLDAGTNISINELRTAVSLQQMLERDARGGGRWNELVFAHWNQHTDDQRLMRPELLSVGSMTINPTPVAQTTQDLDVGAADTPLGNLAAYVVGQGQGGGFTKSFQEHGLCMMLVSIRADLVYQQGLERRFSRRTREDHFWPDLSALGEQAVLSQEIFADGTGDPEDNTGDYEIWGYQPRYEEYRHRQNKITGTMRSSHSLSLDIWHLGQDFLTRPVLNAAYIEENPPVDRVIVVQDEPQWRLDCFFKQRHVRAMPKFGTPGLLRF